MSQSMSTAICAKPMIVPLGGPAICRCAMRGVEVRTLGVLRERAGRGATVRARDDSAESHVGAALSRSVNVPPREKVSRSELTIDAWSKQARPKMLEARPTGYHGETSIAGTRTPNASNA